MYVCVCVRLYSSLVGCITLEHSEYNVQLVSLIIKQ